jgi:UDP:flavonoid glycosyltransferase YjiC (YdhE family)
MRLLFTFVGGQGHLEPLLPIARAASDARHDVSFASRPSMVPIVESLGYMTAGIGPDVPDPTHISPLIEPDAEREERVLQDGFARITAAQRAASLIDLCAENRPDVVVADEVDYGALVAAEKLDVPHATVIVLAAGGFARTATLAEPLNDVRERIGLEPDPDLKMLERDLVIAPAPPSFRDPDFQLGPETLWIRPAVLDAHIPAADPWPKSPDRPCVYVTLGTIFNMESGDLFDRLLTAVGHLDADVLVTVGRHVDRGALSPAPDHVRIEQFVPHHVVLPRADLVISHGGSGTVLGALACGVPQIVLPMGGDQPHNARRCEALGVGRTLDPMRASADDITSTAIEILANPTFGGRAAALAQEARSLPSAVAAVTALEGLVRTH